MIYRLFFFFQAEDGIRDDLVTGVQTCALPILRVSGFDRGSERVVARGVDFALAAAVEAAHAHLALDPSDAEIGRASCRAKWCNKVSKGGCKNQHPEESLARTDKYKWGAMVLDA